MVANMLPADPSPNDPRVWGQEIKIQLAYQITGNHEMQQHSSQYIVRRPPPPPHLDPVVWVNRSEFNFFRTS